MSFASTSVANITISNIYYLSYYIVAKNSTADICLVNVMPMHFYPLTLHFSAADNAPIFS